MATATKERAVVLRPDEVRVVLGTGVAELRRAVKPQPRPGRYGPKHPTMPSGIIGPGQPGQFGDGDYCVWEPPHGPQKGVGIPWAEGCWYRIAPECPFGEIGDRFLVRETWAQVPREQTRLVDRGYGIWPGTSDRPSMRSELNNHCDIIWRSDGEFLSSSGRVHEWRPSTQMPRWASRLTAEVESVRVERNGPGVWEWVVTAKRVADPTAAP